MKIYRLHHIGDGSLGFQHFSSKRDAEREAREIEKAGDVAEIEVMEVEPTKRGIIRALNRYASHPDNG